jgi:hypothetical protein
MTSQVAFIDCRDGDFYVQSWDYSTGRYPMLSQGTWYTKIGGGHTAELGAAVRAALSHSQSGVEFTEERRAEQHKTRRALLKLAGVRGETQYQTGLSTIMVKNHEGQDDLEVTIYDNPNPRKNLTSRPGLIYIVKASSDEELGSRVRDLLTASSQ